MKDGMTYAEIMEALKKPFPRSRIQWKPGEKTADERSAKALAYVDSREYMNRLDDVVGADGWFDTHEVQFFGDRVAVISRLTINGITHDGVGECQGRGSNIVTSAAAQAFKRACVKFGLGRYLYNTPDMWADIDDGRFTDEATAALTASLAKDGSFPAETPLAFLEPQTDPCKAVLAFGKHKGKVLGDIAMTEPRYLKWLAANARDDRIRDAATRLWAEIAITIATNDASNELVPDEQVHE
jgi:hypothetical protein